MDTENSAVSKVKLQYEKWPYPRFPILAKVPREQLWQINYEWMCYQAQVIPRAKPKIWVAGCGTFQPYIISQANPNAEILATDLSGESIRFAEKRCRFHKQKNTTFNTLDLTNFDNYPTDKFDFIELYGVLMCLPDPLPVLKKLHDKLNANGLIRVMVYNHYGRQRITQIQRLAKLLGLRNDDSTHPLRLKKIMKALPDNHPLKYAFFSYDDSRNLEGIADGFLHPFDRTFTGYQISSLLDQAGFELAFCYHRPWGQPRDMAEKLGIDGRDPAFWLHYLDLWQSLKTNFTLCLVKKGTLQIRDSSFSHPLFDRKNSSLGARHKIRLMRLGLMGANLQTKTGSENLSLNGHDFRKQSFIFSSAQDNRIGKFLHEGCKEIQPTDHFIPRIGKLAPNPLYAYLFDAFSLKTENLPSLKEQINTWKVWARPLEDEVHLFGLTPFGTYQWAAEKIEEASLSFLDLKKASFDEVELILERDKFEELSTFLRTLNIEVPIEKGVRRELWCLLFSYYELFLNFQT